MIPPTMLDTDNLSALMKRDPEVIARARDYLEEHARLSFSIVTRYEVLRGLKASKARSRIERFNRFSNTCHIVPVTESVVESASDIYADLYVRGQLIGDADILIAASAITFGFVLATNNVAHFERIDGLTVDNWQS